MTKDDTKTWSRRTIMKSVGGLAAVSMSGATIAQAEEAMSESLPTDPHTRDTYRSIVDAIIPRTPELGDELGQEHAPGGLDIELEKFLVWDFNHFQEIRLETLATAGGRLSADRLEVGFDTTAADSDLDALTHVDGIDDGAIDDTVAAIDDALDALGSVSREEFADTLEFGAVERFEIALADAPVAEDASGPAAFDVVVETADGTTHRVLQNYPYAALFPIVFDIVATEFILLGKNEDAVERGDDQFPGGGTFVQLSRRDRLRCLWSIVDGGSIDRLHGLLSPLVTDVGILKYVVMAVNGLHGFGYYTEWSGYQDTKTAMPNDRHLNVPEGEVQSRQQTGYPGPQPGYAADWRHAVPGGFDDPDADRLSLSDDLTGDDVIDGIGGDTA